MCEWTVPNLISGASSPKWPRAEAHLAMVAAALMFASAEMCLANDASDAASAILRFLVYGTTSLAAGGDKLKM